MTDATLEASEAAERALREAADHGRAVRVGSFDSPGACLVVLETTATEIAGFEWQWGNAAGELENAERALEAAEVEARLGLELCIDTYKDIHDGAEPNTANADDRKALASWYVDRMYPDLRANVARLRGTVERCKSRFKALDRIAGSAQSALAADREQSKREGLT